MSFADLTSSGAAIRRRLEATRSLPRPGALRLEPKRDMRIDGAKMTPATATPENPLLVAQASVEGGA